MHLKNKKIAIWLFTCALIVFLMVAVGGLTRLTESGLSIVKWKPIHGTIPPLNEVQWQEEFNEYKQSPEYIKKNFTMILKEFKPIFWWEYVHRLIGRILGIVFLFPFFYFIIKKQLTIRKSLTLFGIFALGGLQGLVGWWMVKSGLVNDPAVSHFRLATHLSIALLILSLLFWQGLNFSKINLYPNKKFNKLSNILIFTIAVQIIFGAFIAGLDGGLTYNTWPLMDSKFIPAGIKLNLSNIEFIQFFHRWWAFLVIAVVICFNRMVKKENKASPLKKPFIILHSLVGTQIIIGILTLIYVVPIPLASLHQIMAVLILANAVYIKKLVS
jgi:heme a synthase